VPAVINIPDKFEVSSYNPFRDIKSRSRDPFTTPFDLLLHVFDNAPSVVNLFVKFEANIFFGNRYMAISLLCRFGCEIPIPGNPFGEVF